MESRHEIIHFIEDGVEYPFGTMKQSVYGRQIVVDAHYHDFIEILFCLEGSYHIILDGVSYSFSIGDMVVINSNEVHHVYSLDKGMNSYIVIRFNPELLYTTSQTVFEAKYVLPFTMKTAIHQKVFTDKEMCNTPIPDLIKNILSEDQKKAYGFELAIRTHLGEVFLWILRNWYQKGLNLNLNSGLNQEMRERLIRVFNYVAENYSTAITVSDMAEICGMSYSYFSRFFKKAMNRNFSEYVNLVRISKAEHLIAATDKSITEIAMEVGFSTASHFIEQFKKVKGITPKKFRSRFSEVVAY